MKLFLKLLLLLFLLRREADPLVSKLTPDFRITKVQKYLKQCPASTHAALLVNVADENDLDWRLLPVLAFVESTGGKFQSGNNIFGWGNRRFSTVEDSITFVGRQLGSGRGYKRKSTLQKIRIYNRNPRYHRLVVTQMRSLEHRTVDDLHKKDMMDTE